MVTDTSAFMHRVVDLHLSGLASPVWGGIFFNVCFCQHLLRFSEQNAEQYVKAYKKDLFSPEQPAKERRVCRQAGC